MIEGLATERCVDTNLYAGADWLRPQVKTLSPLGERVADLLGWVYCGLYHLRYVHRANWAEERWLQVTVSAGLASYDGSELTRLVIACHDLALRVEIGQAGPGGLRLAFSARERDGDIYHRHPTMEDAVQMARREGREKVTA